MEKDGHRYTQEEFAAIFRKYWGKIYAICYKYARDEGMAKDMVQNIFITLWERDLALRDTVDLEKYLSKAAKYQVFKNARYDKSRPLESLNSLDNSAADSFYNPHQRYLYRELTTQMEKQIALLNEPARTIFRMSRYEALSHKEIALRMGIAVKTVEYHLSKSIKLLRKFTGKR